MNVALRESFSLTLKQRLHGLVALATIVCSAGAMAQGSTVDCAVSSGACQAECSASGMLGSILGGGGAADRKAKLDQCRANCERDRLTCQGQASPSSTSTTPSAPAAGSTGPSPGSSSGAPATRPASGGHGCAAAESECPPACVRENSRPGPVDRATRDAQLRDCFEACKQQRQVCEQQTAPAVSTRPSPANAPVSAPAPARAATSPSSPATTGSSPAPAGASSAGSTGKGTCLEYLRRQEQGPGQSDLALYANRCAHAVHMLTEYGDSCLSSKIEPNLWSMFKVGPGEYKVVRACKAVDRQSTQRCVCAAGSDLPAEMAYFESSLAASTQERNATRPSDRQISAATTSTGTSSGRASSQGECVKFRPPSQGEAVRYSKPEGLLFIRNDCQVSVGLNVGIRDCRVPTSLAPGQETQEPHRFALVCRYTSVLPANTVANDMGDAMASCKCPAGTTSIQTPASSAK